MCSLSQEQQQLMAKLAHCRALRGLCWLEDPLHALSGACRPPLWQRMCLACPPCAGLWQKAALALTTA